jgi:hypothetical protein
MTLLFFWDVGNESWQSGKEVDSIQTDSDA